MNQILKILTENIDWEIKEQCEKRYQILLSQYNYLHDTKNEHLVYSINNGWFHDKYQTLFSLNAFFQSVIGPLTSATQGISNSGLGGKISIAYGKTIKFNSNRNAIINEMATDFYKTVSNLGFNPLWLNQNKASDIVYSIAQDLRNEELN
ncbi:MULTISPECIES: hypothetical protein [Aeromonas]|uniref:hypothetical protein n=1 Tax=Aeromonas TaxID=642 RepID=UPI0011784BCD|nr:MULTISPECIES: hypothetical protein [Aeromonas]MCD6616192.1 hypothetical protein [Aeromonas veronii]MCS0538569.1 hypothetical protein [Aeromonas veronii]